MSRAPAAIAILTASLLAPPAPAQKVEKVRLFEQSLSAAQQALEYYGEYHDPEELARVADIGYRIARESAYAGYPLTFHLIDMLEPNAFALPGGQIFVSRGMLDMKLDDDSLASLLGHEIAHVVLEHGIKMQRRATLLNVLSQAALIGVMVTADNDRRDPNAPPDPYGIDYADDNQKGDLIQGTYAAGIVLSELLLRDYSREFEDQSDEEGQRWTAGAGFDPKGAETLMETLLAHLPEDKSYGYWRTHPFFSDRVRAAGARGELLAIGEPDDASDYRARTQAALLAFRQEQKLELEISELLRRDALTAWPQGQVAEGLRREDLQARRKLFDAEVEISRDYGEILTVYQEQIDEVARLTPESPFLAELRGDRDALREEADALYPQALAILEGDVVSTPFLETFLSNYPDSEEASKAALSLGEAYSRLRRETDAVAAFLQATESGSRSSEEAERARKGLLRLVPHLDRLASLQELADRGDAELEKLAEGRLASLVGKFTALDNGAEYLHRFPTGDHVDEVMARMEVLAQNAYGEVLLYQAVGDSVKAIARIHDILNHAPLTAAAERLRDSASIPG